MLNQGKGLSENRMVLFNLASTILVAGINFFTLPLFTRMLTTDEFGAVNVYVAWVQIFTVFVGLKVEGSISSAQARVPEGRQDSYFGSIALLAILSFGLIGGAVVGLRAYVAMLVGLDSRFVVVAVGQAFGAFAISLFSARYIFQKRSQVNFAISSIVILSTTILSVILIRYGGHTAGGGLGRVYGLALPNALIGAGLLLVFFVRHRAPINLSYWGFCLRLSLPLIFHALGQTLLAQVGRLAIKSFEGDSLAGVFSVAVVISSLLGSIYMALNNAFLPFMFDDLAGKTGPEITRRHFRNYMVLFTSGTCSFALMAPEVLKAVSGREYWGAIAVLPLLVIGQYCVFLYSFPVNYEFFRVKTGSIAVGTALAAGLAVVSSMVLVPRLGMVGAALGTALAYFFLFIFHLANARLFLGERHYWPGAYFIGIGCVLAACGLCWLATDAVLVRWLLGIALLFFLVVRVLRTRSIF